MALAQFIAKKTAKPVPLDSSDSDSAQQAKPATGDSAGKVADDSTTPKPKESESDDSSDSATPVGTPDPATGKPKTKDDGSSNPLLAWARAQK